MSKEVDKFIEKTKHWSADIEKLRAVVLKSKLKEDLKWGKPCYSHNENNIVIIQPFKNFLALMFFKGMILRDPKKVLVNNGPNTQSAKRLEFRSTEEITKLATIIASYIKEAIELENSGTKMEFKKKPESTPTELTDVFKRKPKLEKAFKALSPGRQRAYILFFTGAKQAATRLARIEKCAPQILAGKGMND